MLRGALGAALHNALLLVGVLWLDWSLSGLIAAIWFELLFAATLLWLLSRRSRHAAVILSSDTTLSNPRPPTLRRRCGEFLAATLGVGILIAAITVSAEGLDGWNATSLSLLAVAALIGTIQNHARLYADLRDDRLEVLEAVYHHHSASLSHAIVMLVLVPWTLLPFGPTGALLCFLAARVASDLWLNLHHPLPPRAVRPA